jgi:hypothetical protein
MSMVLGIGWMVVALVVHGMNPFIGILGVLLGAFSKRFLYLIVFAIVITASFFMLQLVGIDLGYSAHNPAKKGHINEYIVILHLGAAYIWTLIGYLGRLTFRNAINQKIIDK